MHSKPTSSTSKNIRQKEVLAASCCRDLTECRMSGKVSFGTEKQKKQEKEENRMAEGRESEKSTGTGSAGVESEESGREEVKNES